MATAAVRAPPPEPMPADDSGAVTLTAPQQAALRAVLPASGDCVELLVDDGGVTRAGVTFTCEDDDPCTVTVTNSLGTIVATWRSSRRRPDAMAGVTAMGHEQRHVSDPLAELNEGSARDCAHHRSGHRCAGGHRAGLRGAPRCVFGRRRTSDTILW